MNDSEKELPSATEEAEELTDPVILEEAVQPEHPAKPQSVARSAGIVSIAVMFSRVLGLVREQVFAYYFGAGFLNDAFQFAFRIPNVLRDLFAEGALSAAFVKVFTDYQIAKSEAEAWRLASLILNALAVVLSVITVIGILLAGTFVRVVGAGFGPEQAALATLLVQIMFPFILLVALAALAMGVLNTKGVFGVPASASTVFNIASIIFGLAFAYWLSGGSWTVPKNPDEVPGLPAQWAITGMAIGTLVGGAAQFAIQIPSLYKVGFRFSPILSFVDPGVKRVMRLMGPAILGTSAVQINVLVNTFFVSGIEGGISWLGYAFRLMQFPIGIFGVAVGTASIPVLSRLAAQGKTGEFRDTLSSSINLVFLMTLPSACGLVVLGEPIIRMLYSHGGAFKEADVPMTAWALSGYAIGLTGYAAIKVLSPAFYAMDDAKTPMLVGVASILVNLLASYAFMNWLMTVETSADRPNGLGHVGVALATSLVAIVNFAALAIIMRSRIKGINGRSILSGFLKIATASAVMSAVCYFSFHYLDSMYSTRTFSVKLIEVFVPIALGGAAFVIMAKLLRVTELEKLYNALARKFR
jgi:putative peptidoglycan lipid II flippase